MSDPEAVAAAHELTDNLLEWREDRERIADERRINEQAYFVLAWGQLEADIDEACKGVIGEGRRNADWRIGARRACSENLRMSFRNRLTLVSEEGSDDRNLIMELYKVRNRIAHGTFLSEGIDVSGIIQDFFRIRLSLVRE